jgi:hypothetical protein
MKHSTVLVVAVALGATVPCSPAQGALILGTNLIVDGDAESGVSGWTTAGQFLSNPYGTPSHGGNIISVSDPGPANRGNNVFWGGEVSLSSAQQTVRVLDGAAMIDSGSVAFQLSGWLGGFSIQDDNAVLTASFLGSDSTVIQTSKIGPVLAADRGSITSLLFRSNDGLIPAGTRSISFEIDSTRLQGTDDDGYADNLSFVATPANIPEPASFVLLATASIPLLSRRRFNR